MFFLYVILIFLVHLSGIWMGRKFVSKGVFNDLLGLAAGMMIATSLIHILPEVSQTFEYASLFLVGGFLAMYILENCLMIHSCGEEHCNVHHISLASWMGMTLHGLVEGVGIGAAFLLSPILGMTVFFGILMHEIPVALSMYALISHGNFSSFLKKILFIIFALGSSVGMLLGYFGFGIFQNSAAISIMISLAGGMLLYVGSSDLLPLVHKRTNNRLVTVTFVVVGVILMAVVKILE